MVTSVHLSMLHKGFQQAWHLSPEKAENPQLQGPGTILIRAQDRLSQMLSSHLLCIRAGLLQAGQEKSGKKEWELYTGCALSSQANSDISHLLQKIFHSDAYPTNLQAQVGV
jgi:hypothetical protein